MSNTMRAATVALLTLTAPAAAAAQRDAVIVNGVPVSQAEFRAEFQRFGVILSGPIAPGSYWYDPVSGLWGNAGGPTMGQILPGLDLGGPLRSDASGGGTAVFINGREIHPMEYLYLQGLFGYVMPGRYWLNAQGIGGSEGGPPTFSLAAAAQASSGGGAGGSGYNRRSLFGDTGSDGNCFYYNSPSGSSVMTC